MRRAFIAAVLIGAIAAPAFAHITVSPRQATVGARQTYTVRAPNERDVATLKVVGEFPAEVTVSSVEPVAGWTVEPRRDAQGRIVGVTWTGSLPARQVAEFGIVATNPARPASLTWKFVQHYAGGEVVEWNGPAGSRNPASVVQVTAPGADAAHADHQH
jgi:uncharacterized protein YcnI